MRVEVPVPPRTGLGLKVPVIPPGAFVESATEPVNPRIGAIKIVEVAEDPEEIIRPDVLLVSAKSGGRSTVKVTVVKCDPVVALPTNMTVYVPGLIVIATLTVTDKLALPPADNEATGTLGAKDTPAAETVGNTWTVPVNPLMLVNDRTVEPAEPA